MEKEQTILRIDVLREMDTGKPFRLSFVTYDKKRGTGGDLRSVVNWCKVKNDLDTETTDPGRPEGTSAIYNPNYMASGIVNIYNPNYLRQHITAVHWQLITFFNGKRVIN